MTVDSVISLLVQFSGTDVGRGILIAVAIGCLKSVPRFLHWLITATRNAPERMLMGTLDFIDRKTSAKGEGLL